jgi:hypothetical protein
LQDCQPMSIAYTLSPDCYRAAIAYRAMLEYYSHCVTLIELHSEEKALSFFARPPVSALTVLMCHGWGESDADAVLSLDVAHQKNRVEYERVQMNLSPGRLGEMLGHGAGIFLNTACWSGKAAFARPLLAAGYDAYIAPEKTSDSFSQYQFVATFIGTSLHEVRDWGPYPVSIRQAFERAQKSDDFWDGAAGFRLFEKEQTE